MNLITELMGLTGEQRPCFRLPGYRALLPGKRPAGFTAPASAPLIGGLLLTARSSHEIRLRRMDRDGGNVRMSQWTPAMAIGGLA